MHNGFIMSTATATPTLNKATIKTGEQIARAAAKSADGWADLGKFNIVHVRRLERAGIVVTDVSGRFPSDPGFRWHVRPVQAHATSDHACVSSGERNHGAFCEVCGETLA